LTTIEYAGKSIRNDFEICKNYANFFISEKSVKCEKSEKSLFFIFSAAFIGLAIDTLTTSVIAAHLTN
jgi:hypothetical protein